MGNRALNYLALMRKANAVCIGETDTGTAVRAGKAKLLILAQDASINAQRRAGGFVYGRNVRMTQVPFTKDEISTTVGKSGCSMAAICDAGFAEAFVKALAEQSPDEYSELLSEMSRLNESRLLREKERRAHVRNKKTGKRRNSA